jgi:hypothetical protein
MAFFASVMLQIAVELAMEDDAHYEAMALKHFEARSPAVTAVHPRQERTSTFSRPSRPMER